MIIFKPLRHPWSTLIWQAIFLPSFRPTGKHLSVERTAVCANMGFVFHRNNEFMFLMIGEGVLALVRPRPYPLQP